MIDNHKRLDALQYFALLDEESQKDFLAEAAELKEEGRRAQIPVVKYESPLSPLLNNYNIIFGSGVVFGCVPQLAEGDSSNLSS